MELGAVPGVPHQVHISLGTVSYFSSLPCPLLHHSKFYGPLCISRYL